MFSTDELRDRFLRFFESKGHRIVASDSLVPADDPTVLFTSAGMNQFKPQFMGHITDFTRATSCQKCLRTDDLPEVGKTPYHHTFFEMLGNFSFGDYFKREAIAWAWEFLTEVLKIEPDRLWVSVHRDDEEAYQIWVSEIGIPEERIARLGDKTNFWPSDAIKKGPNGPCGPCSEIFFDQGEEFSSLQKGHHCGVDCDCGRFAEIWNLVFTQFDRRDGGRLEPLPQKNIDTGMGLERIAAVMQGKKSNFEIDIFEPIVKKVLEISGQKLLEKNKPIIYSVADHIRAAVFAIGDGVIPSNEGRGYVVRKLIRKSVWHMKVLGRNSHGLYELVPVIVEVMKGPYPELKDRLGVITEMIRAEEDRFLRTLDVGLNLIEQEIDKALKDKEDRLNGKVCFLLYDTYGFPLEMSRQIAADRGLSIDEHGFEVLMEEQRRRSQESGKTVDDIFAHRNLRECGRGICFIGYDELETRTQIRAILRNDDVLDKAKEGNEVDIILESCPFYGESGGQVGDRGEIYSDEFTAKVIDTYRVGDVVACRCIVEKGEIRVGDEVFARVDRDRRMDIARHHTATHLLQAALRSVLGEHIQQAGSLVNEERLRFDFTHFKAIGSDEIKKIESLVNDWIRQDIPVEKLEMDIDEARKLGALAFFGEKYGDRVRVVKVGDVSCELCGGTHLDRTGQIGMFCIVSERSISAGVRRIEALAGRPAHAYFSHLRDVVEAEKEILKVDLDAIVPVVEELSSKVRILTKELESIKARHIAEEAKGKVKEDGEVKGVKIVSGLFDDMELDGLRSLWDEFKSRDGEFVGVFVAKGKKKAQILLAASKSLSSRLDMRKAMERIRQVINASGGGRPEFVQGGVKDDFESLRKKWDNVIEEVKAYVEETL